MTAHPSFVPEAQGQVKGRMAGAIKRRLGQAANARPAGKIPRLSCPGCPQFFFQKGPCQGLAKEKKVKVKGGGSEGEGKKKRYTFCTQLTTTTKKRDKTPHAKAKITIKMLTSSIPT